MSTRPNFPGLYIYICPLMELMLGVACWDMAYVEGYRFFYVLMVLCFGAVVFMIATNIRSGWKWHGQAWPDDQQDSASGGKS